MPFLAQGKTNWKFIGIVAVLAIIVGSGVLFYIKNQSFPLIEPSEMEELKETVLIREDFKNWSTHKNKELGFEMKIPPLFEQAGCFINEGISTWSPFENKECYTLSFETMPVEPSFADPPYMSEMILIYICPLDYCEMEDFEKICDIIRSDEYYGADEYVEYYELISGLWFDYLTEGEKYIAYAQWAHGQGDLYDYMGWLKEEVSYVIDQMLSTFKFIDTLPQEEQQRWRKEEGSSTCHYDDTPIIEFIFPKKSAILKEREVYGIEWRVDWWRGHLDHSAKISLLTCDDSECKNVINHLLADVNISAEKYSWWVLSKDKDNNKIPVAECYKINITTLPPDADPAITPVSGESECFNIEWAKEDAFSVIKIYITRTCPYCFQLKEFLDENDIDYEEIDVSLDADVAKEIFAKSGRTAVPVIEIGDEIIVGFDKDRIAEALGL